LARFEAISIQIAKQDVLHFSQEILSVSGGVIHRTDQLVAAFPNGQRALDARRLVGEYATTWAGQA